MMFPRTTRVSALVPAAVAALALAACSDRPTVTEPAARPSLLVSAPQTIIPGELTYSISSSLITTPVPGEVAICKTGTDATFEISIFPHLYVPGSDPLVPIIDPTTGRPALGPAVTGWNPNTVTLTNGTCIVFHATSPHEYTITAREVTIIVGQNPAYNLVSLTAWTINDLPGAVATPCDPDIGTPPTDLEFCEISGSTVTFGEMNIHHGGLATFVNAPVVHICTYTKGFYRNHSDDVAAIIADMGGTLSVGGATLTAAQVQAILDATPGKLGNVTVTSNALLNLTQQIITALLNVQGDASLAPTDVQNALGGISISAGGTISISSNLSQSAISSRTNTLSDFNEGNVEGFPHCDD